MSRPHDVEVADALEELVDQFADPLVFLRELVQNALDAGSPEVDVYTELRRSPEDPERGVMVIGVDDYGEGMDRQIIDTRLTRLFSSAKDGDLTKIGKFGIGFVSVFSLRPDAVCVDTSRGGEHWRILFRADRSFVRIAREHPVDGTKIQVLKTVTRAEHADLTRRAEKTLRYWCKHVAGTVRWNDEEVSEPFDLPDALCTVRHEAEGIRVVVGVLPGGASTFGFYNRGLTLLEGSGKALGAAGDGGGRPSREPALEGVAFKVDSRYLEHTLARNDVMRDANFDEAMAVVHQLAGEPLRQALLQHVAQRLHAKDPPATLDAVCSGLAGVVRRSGVPPQAPVLRAVDGRVLAAGEVRTAAKAGTLRVAARRSPLVDAVVEAGVVVAWLPGGTPGTAALVRALAERDVPEASRTFVRPEPARDAEERARWAPLEAATLALLHAVGVRVAAVALARFDYPGSCIPERVFVLQRAFGALTPWTEHVVRPVSDWARKDTVVVNGGHAGLRPLLALARREPELAAYTLVKLLHLDTGPLPVSTDAELCTASTALRAQRVGSSRGGSAKGGEAT